MAHNNNLAYDYSIFEDKPAAKPEIKTVAKVRKKSRTLSIPRTVFCLFVAIISLSMLLYGRVAQAELDNQQNTVNAQIKKLQDEQTHLEIQLEEKMSLQNIEDIATNQLGLVKLTPSKIEYIDFESESKAVVIKKQTAFDSVKSWFSNIFQ